MTELNSEQKMDSREIKDGWKVLAYWNNAYYSYNTYGHGKVEYKYNEWTKPAENCGPLAVFSDIRDAAKFIGTWFGELEVPIRKCKYIQSKLEHIWINKDGITTFQSHLDMLPLGTVLADEVMILEDKDEEDS